MTDQILLLEPNNDYAKGVRPCSKTAPTSPNSRKYRELFDREATRQLNSAEEKLIPYDDILRYPTDWPDISAIRDQTVAQERGIGTEERAIQAQLERSCRKSSSTTSALPTSSSSFGT